MKVQIVKLHAYIGHTVNFHMPAWICKTSALGAGYSRSYVAGKFFFIHNTRKFSLENSKPQEIETLTEEELFILPKFHHNIIMRDLSSQRELTVHALVVCSP